MQNCHLCGAKEVKVLLDVGRQPICNRFPKTATEREPLFPMRLEQCQSCGLVQTTVPVPAQELKPQVGWITYSEPEGHLDRLADKLAALPGLTRESVFAGITFKDDTLLRRMRERGFPSTWRLDPQPDLGIKEAGVGVETIQDRLTPETARRVAGARGRADVLVVRHIFEHAHRPKQFAAALQELVKPGGHVVVELPDCERALESCDYSTLWEEHVLYFTSATFRQSFPLCGFSLISFDCFPYTLENSLVGIDRVDPTVARDLSPTDVREREKQRGEQFGRRLAPQRERYARFLTNYRKTRGPVAMFGAGHLACTFINVLELKDHLEFVADDNPNKRGLFMPGSRLPVIGSEALLERGIKLCLLSVAAESEEKVIQKQHAFVEAGGVFASIFPASKHALQV